MGHAGGGATDTRREPPKPAQVQMNFIYITKVNLHTTPAVGCPKK